MNIINATPRAGKGVNVTATPKNSKAPHNPKPSTPRGLRRAARRGAAKV